MKYNFDEIIERRGTNSYKWDLVKEDGVIPMWVADMDFQTAPCIIEALQKRVAHGIFGYTLVPDSYYEAIISWFARRHQWNIEKDWILYTSGVVPAISCCLKAICMPGEKVLVQTPVYNCFFSCITNSGCEVVENELKRVGNCTYEIDFEDFERKCADKKTTAFILCNPHNPAGRVWKKEELERMNDICLKHNVKIIADEIHADMPLFGAKHHPFASVSETAAQNSISFGAPSKTFNIAGLVSSYAIVPNETIRKRFFDWLTANELNEPTFMATIATEAAYNHCREWREQMLAYIEQNILFVEEFLDRYIPDIKAIRPQASFIVWLDCTRLHLEHDALIDLFVDKARLALNDGEMFGPEGKGHMRLNVGTPRAVLQKALEQLRSAVDGLKR